MQTLFGRLLRSIVDLPRALAEVAFQGPVEALLLAVGALLVVAASAVLGYLTLGALVDLVTPDVSGRAPPQADR